MSVEVSCPQCAAKFKAPEEKAGKKARCSRCGNSFRIPGAAPHGDSIGESQLLSGIDVLPALPEDDEPVPMATAAEPPPVQPQAAPIRTPRPAVRPKPAAPKIPPPPAPEPLPLEGEPQE